VTESEYQGSTSSDVDLDYVTYEMLRTSDNDWSAERLMWLAVIAQAILDATKEPRSSDSEAICEYRRAATRWLTVVSACVTAEDRECVCEYAGISESQVIRLSTNVLFHGQLIGEVEFLMDQNHALRFGILRIGKGHGPAIQAHRAFGRGQIARHDLHRRRLARAIFAN